MKLLARLVLVAAGGIYLPAVLAGRLAASRGADYTNLLVAELMGGAAGTAVAWAVVSLGRRRRPAAARVFSDLVCLGLGGLWLVALWAEFAAASERLWKIVGWVWAALGGLSVVVWLAARGAWTHGDARGVMDDLQNRNRPGRGHQTQA